MDFHLIEQEGGSSGNHDTFHQFAELSYAPKQALAFYAHTNTGIFWNPGRHASMMVFRPGLRYKHPKFVSHLAVRISAERDIPHRADQLPPRSLLY
ncbi:MAG: hypothetical protein U5N26_10640 [Candidatus Marinimicrobia bacterium]|nr:hypothetical protein [Candidatus Neomarinimicrobiota bacterium]